MVVILIRTAITFITLIIVMRLMGKRQIGEMQPFEFIVTLIIADLACIPMSDLSIPLIYGIVAILSLFFLHQLFSILEQKSTTIKKIISGKPSIVINKSGVDLTELKKNNMGIEDLIESLRAVGYFSLDDVDYAIFESNGNLSAMQSQTKEQEKSSLPIIIVNDGKIVERNLSLISATEQSINAFIKDNGSNVKNTEILTVDGNGRVYFQTKNTPFKILNFPLPKEVSW